VVASVVLAGCGAGSVTPQANQAATLNTATAQSYTGPAPASAEVQASVVNLSNPAASLMVTQVANGHHCWLASNQACADTMTTWIQNWAGVALGGGSSATVQLVAPTLMNPGSTKTFPTSSALFASTIY